MKTNYVLVDCENVQASKIDSVFKSLVKLSYVKVEGTKVQFNGL
jgi:hypothetical protein